MQILLSHICYRIRWMNQKDKIQVMCVHSYIPCVKMVTVSSVCVCTYLGLCVCFSDKQVGFQGNGGCHIVVDSIVVAFKCSYLLCKCVTILKLSPKPWYRCGNLVLRLEDGTEGTYFCACCTCVCVLFINQYRLENLYLQDSSNCLAYMFDVLT